MHQLFITYFHSTIILCGPVYGIPETVLHKCVCTVHNDYVVHIFKFSDLSLPDLPASEGGERALFWTSHSNSLSVIAAGRVFNRDSWKIEYIGVVHKQTFYV